MPLTFWDRYAFEHSQPYRLLCFFGKLETIRRAATLCRFACDMTVIYMRGSGRTLIFLCNLWLEHRARTLTRKSIGRFNLPLWQLLFVRYNRTTGKGNFCKRLSPSRTISKNAARVSVERFTGNRIPKINSRSRSIFLVSRTVSQRDDGLPVPTRLPFVSRQTSLPDTNPRERSLAPLSTPLIAEISSARPPDDRCGLGRVSTPGPSSNKQHTAQRIYKRAEKRHAPAPSQLYLFLRSREFRFSRARQSTG